MSNQEEIINKKILIIEDDVFLEGLMVDYFKEEGINFDLAQDAEIGMKKAKENRPNLILLDLVLPGMDGYEFLAKIKADEELASIPVIIISNLGQKDEIERGMKLGAKDFFVKAHIDLDELAQKVRQVLKETK